MREIFPFFFPLVVILTMSVSAGCVKVLILRGGGCIFIRNKDVGVGEYTCSNRSSFPVHFHTPTLFIRHTPLAKCKSKPLHMGRYL